MEATSPTTDPQSAITSNWKVEIPSPKPSIQAPGMVKASPPATMAPDDITVWVTFASLSDAFRCLNAFRAKSDMRAAKMIGQGSAPILRATYTEDAVMRAHPKHPMTMPRSVS